MIIESIKACGFLDIGPEKKLKLHQQFGKVNNSTIIKVLSIVFDSTYHSTFDLFDFINQAYNGKHLIEVVLVQNDDNLVNNFTWLNDKRLTLERNLEDSKVIKINGKNINVDMFHEAISSLGFISIDGFHMHRLLGEEINKLSNFTGEDLWSLILKVNDCEDLVRSIELKNKKDKVLKEQMEKQLEVVEDVLPLKIQLRDDIRSQFLLTREFNTLNSIASERKLKILQNEKQVNIDELQQLKDVFNEKSLEVVNMKHQHVVAKTNYTADQTMSDLIKKERNWLIEEIDAYKVPASQLGPAVLELYNRIVTIESSTVTCFKELEQILETSFKLESEKIFKVEVDVEMFNWMISFKLSSNEEDLKIKQAQYKLVMNRDLTYQRELNEKITNKVARIEQLKTDLKTVQQLNPQQMFDRMRTHYQLESEMKRTMINLKVKAIEYQRQILETDKKMFSAATLGGFNLSMVETMRAVENFISKDPQRLVDYLGPVFSHLKPQPEIEYIIWSQLSPLANVFLFVKGSSARKALREMKSSNIDFGSYTLLGIDEFVPTNKRTLPEELDNKVRSAEALIDNISHVSVQKAIKLMLQDIRFMEEKGKEDAAHNISTYNICNLVHRTKEAITLHSLLPNIFEAQGTSPIEVLRDVYELVKKSVGLEKKLLGVQELIEQLEHQLKDHQKILPPGFAFPSFATFLELSSLLKEKYELQKQNAKNDIFLKAMKELDEKIDLNTCDVDELRGMKAVKASELLEEDNLKKMLEFNIKTKIKEIKLSAERIINHSNLMRKMLSGVLNPFELFIDVETQKLKNELIKIFETQLEDFNLMLQKIRENIQPPPMCTNEAELVVELIDLRCRLYEKNSEKNVIDVAMKKCQKSVHSDGSKSLFDQRLYEEFLDEDSETLATALVQCQEKLHQHEVASNIGKVTTEQYGHLIDSIKKVEKYSASPNPAIKRHKLISKAFPMINKILVKMLKDAVYNYRSSFKAVMGNFIRKSSLYFYTHGLFDEIGFDSFSWECFDMARLKAMDFSVTWTTDGKEKIPADALRKVKGFLLILHIINYISIFKFIVIDETIFEDMDESLVESLRKLLGEISSFVQIILLDSKAGNEEDAVEDEPMDTSG